VIPKSEDVDPLASKKLLPCAIAYLAGSIIMSATVQLSCQFGFWAIKIEDIRMKRMLPTKFVACEISVPQVPPKNAFPLGRMLAQITSTAHGDIWGARCFFGKLN
jgi:hypothetical protein